MKKINFEKCTLVDDDGTQILGVLLTGDGIPIGKGFFGEQFFEFPTEEDVETALAMLNEYASRKMATGICGVRACCPILVGLCPKDIEDDDYKEFEFSCYDAECNAFGLIKQYCKYQFGRDSTNDDWESSLHDD